MTNSGQSSLEFLSAQVTSLPHANIGVQNESGIDAGLEGRTMLPQLLNIGFRVVGRWQLEDKDAKLCFLLDSESNSRNILYAFISGTEILYIGKTTQPLRKRMYGYQNPSATQNTNVKGNKFISDLLHNGNAVEIYALPDNGLLHFGAFHINLAAGLEDSLITKLQPKWNGCGLGS